MSNKKNTKQELILISAKELFWKYGFRRVSIEEVCKNASVSKMTFYKYYANKIELAKKVYNSLIDKGVVEFHNVIHEKSSPEDKIKKLLLLKLEATDEMSNEFLQDFYSDTELGLKEFIQTRTEETWKIIIDDFVFAQNQGWFRKDIKPELFLLISQKFAGLVNDANALQLYKNPQDLIMAISNFFIYGLIVQKS